MSFDHPQGLWLLTLGIPILAFHFYKGRIRKMPVPLLLFWEQIIVEEERQSAFRRIRHWTSLLISLGALVLLTSAVSLPNVRGFTRPKARYALIFESAPRMAAVEGGGRTRAELAVDRAREFLGTLAYGDQASALDRSGARLPFTSDLAVLSARLSVSRPSKDGVDRDLVLEALAAGEDVVAVLFGDRLPPGVDDLLENGRLRVVRVGSPRDNCGWVAGRLSRRAGERSVTIALQAESFAARSVERDEVLSLNGRALARRKLALAPATPVEREWVLDPAKFPGSRLEEGGLVEVALEPADAFPLDDVASFVLPPLVPPPVIVFHPGEPSAVLMHALETLQAGGLIGGQSLSKAPIARYESLKSKLGEGWLIIFDRVAPPSLPDRGGVLLLGAPGTGAVEKPTVVDWAREAPPNRRIDYGGLLIRKSRILQGDPLIRALEGPVATWSARGGRALVEIGFALEESDIAARPTFLLMLINLIEWAPWRGLRSFPTQLAMGEPLRAERPLWIEDGDLTFAQGDRAERIPVSRGLARTSPSAGPGFARLGAVGRSEWVAVNLFDAAESDFREKPAGAAGIPLPPPAPWHAKVPYAFLAVVGVLTLLLAEWFLYHRGLI
ncbi:MAG TPA: BatA domain-containing protein [Planctomycetota bacterium]|nr:BatA domain-containing protein [Planctomycetota bacterium]